VNGLYQKESVTRRALSWYKIQVTKCAVCFTKCRNT